MPASLDAALDGVRRAVEGGLVPGAAVAVGTAAGGLAAGCYGFAQLQPERRPLQEDMLFDLASLTKVVATTTLVLQAIERGDLWLTRPVSAVLPEFGQAGKEDVTLRHLLTHTSGLPAWVDLAAGGGRSGALEAVWRTPLVQPPERAVVYSDLGFITLGEVVSRLAGLPLERLALRDIFEPLGMTHTRYRPTPSQRARCVTTEVDETRGPITGEVHDENCGALGGVAGHAGLFSTLDDLERFCRLMLSGGTLDGVRVLSGAAVALATRDHTGHVDQQARRGLGWVLQPNGFWPAADLASPAAYSHTGFTGTSLMFDPERGLYAVLLTNRVHPTRGGDSAARIRALRARFHNAVWAALA